MRPAVQPNISAPPALAPMIMGEAPEVSVQPFSATPSRGWLAAALGFVVLRSLPNLSYPIGRDQATFLVIGQGLLNGLQLYRDLWDNKPPGIFYIFAAIVKIFDHAMWSVGLVDIVWLLAISYFIFRFAERYLGTAAAVVAVIFNASWHVQTGYWEALQAETFLMLCVLGSFFLVVSNGRWVRARLIAGGLLMAGAFWLKYNAIVFAPLLIVLPYLDLAGLDARPRRFALVISGREWLRRATIFSAAFAATVGAGLAYFWLRGTWPAMEEVQFQVLPRYAAMAYERTEDYWLWAILQTDYQLGPYSMLASVLALWTAFRSRELARYFPVIAFAAFGYLCLVLQVRFPPYGAETCLPFLAMVWGYVAVKVFELFRGAARLCARRGWGVARVLVWVAFANVALWPVPGEVVSLFAHYEALRDWRREGTIFYESYPWANPISHFPDQMRVIEYLKKNPPQPEGLFIWGTEPLIYFLSGTSPPNRFVSNLALLSPWAPDTWRNELVHDLEKSPPRFIVVGRDDAVSSIAYTFRDSERYLEVYPALNHFISRSYREVLRLKGYVVYRRS